MLSRPCKSSHSPFVLANRDDAAGRADLRITAPFGISPSENTPTPIAILSKIELSLRTPWLPPEVLPFLALPVHDSYDSPANLLPPLPVIRAEEAIAEKLARYSRVALARDLYDLVWYGRQAAFDEELIRRLWILKIYNDVVLDHRWSRRFDPADILRSRHSSEIDEESIGYLTHPVDILGWEREFRQRFAFLGDLNREDLAWARCHAGDKYQFQQIITKMQVRVPRLALRN